MRRILIAKYGKGDTMSCIMIDAIKNTLLAGLGATVITAERVEKRLSELVEKGKLNAEEAKQTADKIVEDGKQEWEKSRSKLADEFETLLKKAKVATEDDVKALEERVAQLEKAVAAQAEAED